MIIQRYLYNIPHKTRDKFIRKKGKKARINYVEIEYLALKIMQESRLENYLLEIEKNLNIIYNEEYY